MSEPAVRLEEPATSPYNLPPEVERARMEDPDFPEVLGRVRAAIKMRAYNPDVHHPDAIYRRMEKEPARRATDDDLEALLARFQRHGWRSNPADRDDVRKVAGL